ncbi:helix-turn-helix domain-containing protein [Limnoglobus roseus]|uniref:Helix-turn-helix domain-containing protein n=1 Tax=Limnoglobus roseus TaxID=2598579 RepID=A0A5C1AK31_9BACT|nr:helix-turn-helix domain-containing protein [Limnoglobus roseus]QEL19561.1 hypothetical protein PX52LOC_06637 [Limnoglobus roseus]
MANDPPEDHRVLMTKAEVATRLKVCRNSVDRLRASGKLPAVSFGRKILWQSEVVENFIRQHEDKPMYHRQPVTDQMMDSFRVEQQPVPKNTPESKKLSREEAWITANPRVPHPNDSDIRFTQEEFNLLGRLLAIRGFQGTFDPAHNMGPAECREFTRSLDDFCRLMKLAYDGRGIVWSRPDATSPGARARASYL